MRPLRKIASDLLGFNRRERRATFTLALILISLLLLRVFLPGRRAGGENIVIPYSDGVRQPQENRASDAVLFGFDPNTATGETLLQLGFSERQAATLINYRKAGARFRKASDISRVYGIDSMFAARLLPWIEISHDEVPDDTERKARESRSPGYEAGKPGAEAKDRYSRTDGNLTEARTEQSDRNLFSPESPAPTVYLNSCSAADLVRLPGIGEVLSTRIVKYRDLLGGYVSVEQLREVYGLDSTVVEMNSGKMIVSSDSIRLIGLDTCSWGQMARHPYLGPEAARAVMKYRSLTGRDFTVDDLVLQRVISAEQAARIRPYVTTPGKRADN